MQDAEERRRCSVQSRKLSIRPRSRGMTARNRHSPGLALAVLSLALFLVFDLTSWPTQADTLQESVIVGWSAVPGEMERNMDGTPSGFIGDLAIEIAREAGLDLEFRQYASLRELADAQRTGEAHLIAGVGELPPFGDTSVFSDPVAVTGVHLYVRAETAAGLTPHTFVGRKVGIVPPFSGSAPPTLLERNSVEKFASLETAVFALLKGEVDGLVLENAPTDYVLRAVRFDHRIVTSGPPLRTVRRVVAVHKSRAELLPAINAAIVKLEENGTLGRLRNRWSVLGAQDIPETLTVGLTHYPPYNVIEDGGTITGYAVEVLRDLGELTGLRFEFREVTLEAWRAGPGMGGYDMLPQLLISPERLERMDFTLPIVGAANSIFVRREKEAGIRNLADLHDMRVAVSNKNAARRIVEAQNLPHLKTFDSIVLAVAALAKGDVDALAGPTPVIRALLREHGATDHVVEISPPFAIIDRAIALRFGLGQVRERLNAVIPGYLSSPDYSEERAKWFGEPRVWTDDMIRVAITIFSLGLAVLASALAMEWFKRRRVELQRAADQARFGMQRAHHEQVSKLVADLKRSNALLEHSNAELDQFAYIASHDLKAPLRTIDNASRWLLEDLEPHFDDDTRESMDLLRNRVQRMERLLDDLLTHSRIGRMDEPSAVVPLASILDDVAAMAAVPDRFELTIDNRAPNVRLPRMPLFQVLLNLVTNAYKHHDRPDGKIRITAHGDEDGFVFEVSDDGPGIEPEFHDRVFALFQTLKPRDQVEGSGMGLAIVKKIVDVADGRIELCSKPGRGSTFRIFWPGSASLNLSERKGSQAA